MSQTSSAYILLTCASAVLSQLAIELGRGTVPIPHGWEWVVPLISAALVALTARLPKIGDGRGK